MKDLKELNILLAEDNRMNQRIALLKFGQMGISIDIASNGQQVFDMFRQNSYDLILMDLQMPVMDGLEATRLIRAFEEETNPAKRVYIVALTANAIAERKEECIQAGMNNFMEKPFQERTLRDLFSKTFN